MKANPTTEARKIDGTIMVRTQFQHILKNDGKTTRDQDIKVIENNDDDNNYL